MAVFVEQFTLGNGDCVVAVKDTMDVAGYATRAGSAALADAKPALRHADVVENVLAADCKLIGKLNMHELAYGMTGVNALTGTPVNPLYPHYMPGGSSSGAAVAVADGSVDFSLGTDTGGSIRVPAACCGVFGLKPTYGRVSRRGVLPVASSLDCVGPMAASAELLIKAMTIIDNSFVPCTEPGLIALGRVAVNVDPAIDAAVNACLNVISMDVGSIELPAMEAAFKAGLTVINAECWAAFGDYLQTNQLGEDVATRLRAAKNTSAEDLAVAEKVRLAFCQQVDRALVHFPVLVLPTLPHFPLSRAQALAGQAELTLSSLVRPFNLSGHPALSLPLAEVEGRPVGLQLVAAKGQDALLCEVARLISQQLS